MCHSHIIHTCQYKAVSSLYIAESTYLLIEKAHTVIKEWDKATSKSAVSAVTDYVCVGTAYRNIHGERRG